MAPVKKITRELTVEMQKVLFHFFTRSAGFHFVELAVISK